MEKKKAPDGIEMAMSLEELQRAVRREWDAHHALTEDLQSLPEYPSLGTLRMLKDAAMSYSGVHDLHELGIALRDKWYKDNPKAEDQCSVDWVYSAPIPYKSEYECAAGMWTLIRKVL